MAQRTDPDPPPSLGLLRPGEPFGSWSIEGELGRGAMGVVYAARRGAQVAALKVVHPHLVDDPSMLRRLQREVEAGVRVRHPNVVPTLGLAVHEGGPRPRYAVVMELVRGVTLAETVLLRGALPESEVRDLARQVASGLAAIHAVGLVHRDVKPENVLLTEGHVAQVMDLGLVRPLDARTHLSRSGQFVGSLLYAAPEQLGAERGAVTPAADLYALGLLIYELVRGERPIEAVTVADVLRAHLETVPPLLRSRSPGTSAFLEHLVASLLEKDPRARPGSALEVASALALGEASSWWRERRPGPARTGRCPGPLPLLGRDAELERLVEGWGQARRGEAPRRVVVGEPGLGRTRLLQAFVERCELEGSPALLALGTELDGGGTDVETRLRAFALPGLRESGEGRAPTVLPRALLVDDPHLLNETTCALLLQILRSDEPGLLVVLAAALPLAPALEPLLRACGAAPRIELGPLADPVLLAHAADVRGSMPSAPPASVVHQAVAAAGGSPGLLRELLAARSGMALPLEVHRRLEGRLDALEPAGRTLLEAAAVLGPTFDLPVLAATLRVPVSAVLERVEPLARAPIMLRGEGGRRAFTPTPLRQLVLERMAPEARVAWHARAADAWQSVLDSGRATRAEGLPELARHHVESGQPQRSEPSLLEALDLLVRGKRSSEALELAALTSGQAHLLRPRVAERLHLRHANLLAMRGQRQAERRALEAALAICEGQGSLPGPAFAAAWSRCLLVLHDRATLAGDVRRWLSEARRAGDEALVAAWEAADARLALDTARLRDARRAAERSLLAARACGSEDLVAEALGLVGRVLELAGGHRAALSHQAQRLGVAALVGSVPQRVEALGALARLEATRDRWPQACTHAARQAAGAQDLGWLEAEAEARLTLGLGAAATARSDVGVQLREALRLARAAGAERLVEAVLASQVRFDVTVGEPPAHVPEPLVERASAAVDARGAHARLALAEVAASQGRIERALDLLEPLLDASLGLDARTRADALLVRAEALQHGSDASAIRAAAAAALEAARFAGWGAGVVQACALAAVSGGPVLPAVQAWIEHGAALDVARRLLVARRLGVATADPWYEASVEAHGPLAGGVPGSACGEFEIPSPALEASDAP